MGLKYLLDTNTVIYYLTNHLPATAHTWLNTILAESQHSISVIARIELLSKEVPLEQTESIQQFIVNSFELGLTEDIV